MFRRIISVALLYCCVNINVAADTEIITYDFQGQCISDWRLLYGSQEPSPNINSFKVTEGSSKTRSSKQAMSHILKFYDSEFGWKSADNENSPIYLLTNLSINTNNGNGCDGMNASYIGVANNNLHQITIRNLHDDYSKDMSQDLDVIGHEFSHAVFRVTQGRRRDINISILNESIADMFGTAARFWVENRPRNEFSEHLVPKREFYMGKKLASFLKQYSNNVYPDNVIRHMANPHNRGAYDFYDFDEMQEEYNRLSEERRSGMYYKAGAVTSLAYVLMSSGGEHPRLHNGITVEGMGVKKAINIIFYTLENKLPFRSLPTFADAVRKATRKMYGSDSCEYRTTHNAFAAVGLFDSAITDNCLTEDQRAQQDESKERQRQQREELEQQQREQQDQQSENERTELEKERQRLEKEAQEQTEREQRIEQERQQREQQERERLEAERIEREKQEQSKRQEQQQQQEERQERERLVKENKNKLSSKSFILIFSIFIGSLLLFVIWPRKKIVVNNHQKTVSPSETQKSQQEQSPPIFNENEKSAIQQKYVVNEQQRKVEQKTTKVDSDKSVELLINLAGQSAQISISEDILTLGRECDLKALPSILTQALTNDTTVSRKHCDIWFNSENQYLYIYNYSINGTYINADKLNAEEKGKVTLNKPVEIKFGNTTFTLSRV
jgi:hypothetical protein